MDRLVDLCAGVPVCVHVAACTCDSRSMLLYHIGLRLLKVVVDFERQLSASASSESLVKAVDNKFRKSAQDVHNRYSKVQGAWLHQCTHLECRVVMC